MFTVSESWAIFRKLVTSRKLSSMPMNLISFVMFSKPWFGRALLFEKEARYSEVCRRESIRSSLFLKGTMLRAFSLPISVLQREETVCKMVANSKSLSVLSVMEIIFGLSQF